MDEVFNQIKQLYGKFSLNISTDVADGVMKHIVVIRVLVAGKALSVTTEGTGNVAEVVKQSLVQLQLAKAEVLNSKEVKGIPGMLKPIVRVSDNLHPANTAAGPVVLRPIHTDGPVVLRPIHVVGEDDPCFGCASYDSCHSDNDDYEDEDYDDDDYDDEESDEDPEEFVRGQRIARGIKFLGTEEDVKREASHGIKLIGKLTDLNNPLVQAGPTVVRIILHEVMAEPVAPAAPAAKKLCCALSSKRGYKFCPDCGARL
jgi:hypothetical protein